MEAPNLTNQILAGNEAWRADFGTKGELPVSPTKKALVLLCMDARLDSMRMFGFEPGEVHQVRTGGGRAVDAIRSIVCSQEMLSTREIHIVHHTDCGFTHFTTPDLQKYLKARDPSNEALKPLIDSFSGLEFTDPAQSVKEDVAFLKSHPLVLKESKIFGWVYETRTGKLDQVC